MMEKRVLIAALLSAVFLTWYSAMLAEQSRHKPNRAAPTAGSSDVTGIAAGVGPKIHQPQPLGPLSDEQIIVLRSPDLLVEIGASSGAVRSVALQEFNKSGSEGILEFRTERPIFGVLVGGEPIAWQVKRSSQRSVVLMSMDPGDSEGEGAELSYALSEDNPVVDVDFKYNGSMLKPGGGVVSVVSSWTRADKLPGRYNPLEVYAVADTNGGKPRYRGFNIRKDQTYASKNVPRGTFPAGTQMITLSERYFCNSVDFGREIGTIRIVPTDARHGASAGHGAQTVISAVASFLNGDKSSSNGKLGARVYFGPRDHSYLDKAGFESALKIGWFGQIGLVLLIMLGWVAGVTHNYGIAVILFSAVIGCILAPFTLMSFKSMKKMQELKPEIDRVMARHKGDPAKANQAMMALYKEHKVSPLSGCLPLFLQFPIFIALFRGIPRFIELRGVSFLWISDLSLPDRIATLPFSIPLLGSDINLLPIITAVAMFIQTKMSQQGAGAAQTNPMAKAMSGPVMPIFFGLLFYQFPAALLLYWITNTVTSILWYRLGKR